MYKGYYITQIEAEDGAKLSIEDYDEKAKVWHSIFFNSLPARRELPRIGNLVRVLDVACNTGYNTVLLQEKYGYAEGIDINPRLIRKSKANTYNCRVMNMAQLDYDDESFSLVVAKDAFEHSNVPDKAISEAYRVLAYDGVLVCMLPLDGEPGRIDEIVSHQVLNFGNISHYWKATLKGLFYRLFSVGFTDLEYALYSHKQLFNQERPFGDIVALVVCRKKRNVIRLPFKWLWGNSYWAAFITLRCNANCKYCIQTMSPMDYKRAWSRYAKNELDADTFITTINRFQRYKNAKYSVIGGEPTIRDDFLYIVNSLEGYNVTATTNLSTPIFNNPEVFAKSIKNPKFFRLNTSFHPHVVDIDEFCSRVKKLRECGIFVDQVAMVDYPGSGFEYYYHEFIKRDVVLTPQSFLGKIGPLLYPNDRVSYVTNDVMEHGIDDYDLYRSGFSCDGKSDILCNSRRFLLSPDGGVYDCHYRIYSRKDAISCVKDLAEGKFNVQLDDYRSCKDFGFCNPCDFPHVKFKSTDINEKMREISSQKRFSNLFAYIDMLRKGDASFNDLVVGLAWEIYLGEDLFWQIYNSEKIRRMVNEYMEGPSFIDNTNAYKLARFDILLREAMGYVNLYRIFSDVSRIKYFEAMALFVSESILGSDGVQERLNELAGEGLHLDFKAELGKLYNTFVTLNESERLMFVEKDAD